MMTNRNAILLFSKCYSSFIAWQLVLGFRIMPKDYLMLTSSLILTLTMYFIIM